MDTVEKYGGGPSLGVSFIQALLHFQHREFAHLSATRWTQPEEERDVANKGMEGAIKALELGFVSMVGGGKAEQPDHTLKPSTARSYFVPNQTRADTALPDFLAKMLVLASAYRQKYIIHGIGDRTADLVRPSGEVVQRYTEWHPAGITFFTALRRKTPLFHLESIGRVYRGGTMLTVYGTALRGEILQPEKWPIDPKYYTPCWGIR